MFSPWVGKMPWRRAWQPTPVFLPGDSRWTEELGGLQSMGSQRVGTSDRLSIAQLSSLPPWTQTHASSMVFSPVTDPLSWALGLPHAHCPLWGSHVPVPLSLPCSIPFPTHYLTRVVNSTRTCLLHVQLPSPHTVFYKPTHHCPLLTFAHGLLYPLELLFS